MQVIFKKYVNNCIMHTPQYYNIQQLELRYDYTTGILLNPIIIIATGALRKPLQITTLIKWRERVNILINSIYW